MYILFVVSCLPLLYYFYQTWKFEKAMKKIDDDLTGLIKIFESELKEKQ